MTLKFAPLPQLSGERLMGSRDPGSGEVYFPPRHFSADGALRVCEEVALPTRGVLYAFTAFAGQTYGQVDLDDKVRVLALLADGEHELGAAYALEVLDGDPVTWRFRHA